MKNNKWYSYLALVLAITAWAWAVLVNIWTAYLFALAALVLYFIARKTNPGSRINNVVLKILIIGGLLSLIGLLFLF